MDNIRVGQGIPFDPTGSEQEPERKPQPPKQDPLRDHSRKEFNDRPGDLGPDLDLKPTPKKQSPVLAVLLFILLLAAVSAAVYFYLGKEDQTKKLLSTKAELQQTVEAKMQVTRQLNDLTKVKKQLQMDLDRGKENYRLLMQEYTKEQADKERIVNKYSSKMKEIASLKSRLEKEQKENQKSSFQLQQINKDYGQLKSQLTQIRRAKEALEKKMITLSRNRNNPSPVELESVVVNKPNSPEQATGNQPQAQQMQAPQQTQQAQAGQQPVYQPLPQPAKLEGQVLVVNTEFQFVVVNLGQKDGLKMDQQLQVYNGTMPIGKVQVERIYDTMSSAVIMPGSKPIKEGYIVKVM